jgi:uncharacterized membrane protein YkgB
MNTPIRHVPGLVASLAAGRVGQHAVRNANAIVFLSIGALTFIACAADSITAFVSNNLFLSSGFRLMPREVMLMAVGWLVLADGARAVLVHPAPVRDRVAPLVALTRG